MIEVFRYSQRVISYEVLEEYLNSIGIDCSVQDKLDVDDYTHRYSIEIWNPTPENIKKANGILNDYLKGQQPWLRR